MRGFTRFSLLMRGLGLKLKFLRMRYLGIDYGTKRIGIALSDEEGRIAYPKEVIPNSPKGEHRSALDAVAIICRRETVGAIVMGESRDYSGAPNAIWDDARKFGEELARTVEIPLFFEPEFLTSAQAERIQGKTPLLDASAAAIILQSYLDRGR